MFGDGSTTVNHLMNEDVPHQSHRKLGHQSKTPSIKGASQTSSRSSRRESESILVVREIEKIILISHSLQASVIFFSELNGSGFDFSALAESAASRVVAEHDLKNNGPHLLSSCC
jgi:hypothetical protein